MMQLIVTALRINGDDNVDIELAHPDGIELPPFAPGAHVDIRTPSGSLRQYSLCGPATDRRVYHVCVRLDPASRGGSRSLHADLRLRAKLDVSLPRNLFELPEAKRYLLFSAGIGITPIISMARHLADNGADFEWHHYEKGPGRVAFLDELTNGPISTGTTIHLGELGDSFRNASPEALRSSDPDTVVLACGPNPFLDLLSERMAEFGWSPEQLHSERFRPIQPAATGANVTADTFEIRVASTGQSFSIGPQDTIANVLQANGIAVDLSCEQGMCGACLTRVLEGEPDHRDIILSEAERATNNQMTICCSRSRSATLTLDL